MRSKDSAEAELCSRFAVLSACFVRPRSIPAPGREGIEDGTIVRVFRRALDKVCSVLWGFGGQGKQVPQPEPGVAAEPQPGHVSKGWSSPVLGPCSGGVVVVSTGIYRLTELHASRNWTSDATRERAAVAATCSWLMANMQKSKNEVATCPSRAVKM